MGIVISYFAGEPNAPDPVTGLTPRETMLVQNSWNMVKKDMVKHGVQMFVILVTRFPQYKPMFPFRDVPNEELSTHRKMKGHATNVMYALSAVIDNLSNNDLLMDLLEKSGEAHGKRKIPPQAYWDLKGCILQTLQEGLGSSFTEEAEKAWDKTIVVAFNVIVKILQSYQEYDKQEN